MVETNSLKNEDSRPGPLGDRRRKDGEAGKIHVVPRKGAYIVLTHQGTEFGGGFFEEIGSRSPGDDDQVK
jgi:hypothetical protein